MTKVDFGKVNEIVKTSVTILSLIFAIAIGYVTLKSDVKHLGEDVFDYCKQVDKVKVEQVEIKTVVSGLTVEIKNLNTNLDKLEKKL